MNASPKIKFVENKAPDMQLVSHLLSECEAVNQWANFGPLYTRLGDEYAQYMGLGSDLALTPCANGGIALELLARGIAAEQNIKKLRWVGSAFSFKNLGRGYFADMKLLDCDSTGVLDIAELEALVPESFDGFIVTNPFGMCADFEPFIRFAKTTGKSMLIDNAAGIDRKIPNWPWQTFSLHQTKPYGMGEGGLALSPSAATELLRYLINYDKAPADPSLWLNNGKISDIACAFQISRLRAVSDWETGYREQRERVAGLFAEHQLKSLLPHDSAPLTNGLPILFPAAVDDEKLSLPRSVDIARQYIPLASRQNTNAIFSRLVTFPTHPGLCQITDDHIRTEIELLLACQIN